VNNLNEHTKRLFDETDWDSFENAKVLEKCSDDKVLAVLEIRGETYQLLDYDWYMLVALEMTDGFDYIDFSYVVSLRISIRKDTIKLNSRFIDMLHKYEYYSLASLDKYMQISDEYSDRLANNPQYDELRKWLKKKQNELDLVLIKIPQNKRK